jgi:hypothetical protein
MMVSLTLGMVAIVGAAVREAQLDPGSGERRWGMKSLVAMGGATAVLLLLLWTGNAWWADEASDHAR